MTYHLFIKKYFKKYLLFTAELFKKVTELHKQYGDRVAIKVMSRYVLHIFKMEDIEVSRYIL